MPELLFDHIVVLMLENRSFDHLFGYLGKGEGLPADVVNYEKPGVTSSKAFHPRKGGDFTAIGDGPSHSLKSTNLQLFGVAEPDAATSAAIPPLSGFVKSFQNTLTAKLKRKPTDSEVQQVMNVFEPVQLPVLSTLAKEFVLCDRWFADVPGPTMPNRAFVHAATSQGYTYNADWKPVFTCKTLYDRINDDPSRSWRVYSHDSDEVMQLYPNVKRTAANSALFAERFLSDVAADRLPSYSFIIPGFFGEHHQPANSMHAPQDVRPAERLVADIYGALRDHPEVWKKTLFMIVFDENGGYYDHVPPPKTVSPDNIAGRLDQPFLVPFDFKRLGLRVPCILVSPWFKAGVDSTVYSHSTIPGSVIEAFGLPKGFLTKRDKEANKLTETYLTKKPGQVWRTNTPDLAAPVQPAIFDELQRELLDGSVHLDPHPRARNVLRTRDIQDHKQARAFIRTQIAKHLEHSFAWKGRAKPAREPSADNQPAMPQVSSSRIAELRRAGRKRG